MQAKTHEITGISMAVAATALICEPELSMVTYGSAMVAGAAVGSLLPDIDHGGSKISREHKIISKIASNKLKHRGITHSLLANALVAFVCFAVSYLIGNLYDGGFIGRLVVSSIMTLIVFTLYNHLDIVRKTVNDLIPYGKYVVGLLTFGVVYFSSAMFIDCVDYLALGLTIGYFSHLVADACTVSGVAFLQPFSSKTFHFAKFHTGEHEGIFRSVCVVATLLLIVWRCL